MELNAVENSYARWAPVYDATFGAVTTGGRRRAVKFINQKPGSVLEVGVGTGLAFSEALTLGAQGVQCGTAFLATEESFAHEYHKQKIVEGASQDTVLTDGFVLNWPRGSMVRVLRNSVIDSFDGLLTGHDPATIPRQVIAHDGDTPRLRQSTDSPLRTTTGELEQMPLYAGTGVDDVAELVPAAQRLLDLCNEAEALLAAARKTPGQGAGP